METTTIIWKGKKWTLSRPVGTRYWNGTSMDNSRATFVQGRRGNFICLHEHKGKYSSSFQEQRQKDMPLHDPDYQSDLPGYYQNHFA